MIKPVSFLFSHVLRNSFIMSRIFWQDSFKSGDDSTGVCLESIYILYFMLDIQTKTSFDV